MIRQRNEDDDYERIWKEVRTQPTLTLKRLSINQLINKTNSRPNERKKNPKNERERERERERNRERERERERNRERERERMLIKYCKTSITLRKLYWMMLASEKGPNGQTEEKQKIQFLTLLGTR